LPNQQTDDTARATARLPGLEVEIVHCRSPAADAEQISINLQAVPSFEAFGQFLQTANRFAAPDDVVTLARIRERPDVAWSVASAPPKL
jgi:hypothetical protein